MDMGVNKILGSSISSHGGVPGAQRIFSLLRTRELNKICKGTIFGCWATLILEEKIEQDGPVLTPAFCLQVLPTGKGVPTEHSSF